MISYQQYLRDCAVAKEVIDAFLDGTIPTWAQFDSEVGYKLGNSLQRDGLDGCLTISTVQENEARRSHMYTDRPCRINTYGDSFTQCHQVSDGETWQEYLAAHLGEPVRNFGMGGYGTFQAYRRMVSLERTKASAKYILLYIWGDDHYRSVLRCRHAWIRRHWDPHKGKPFHGNFWANIEMDLDSGQLVEKDNILPTPESLYKMTDGEFMIEALNDDLMLQLHLIGMVDLSTVNHSKLNTLADILGVAGIETNNEESLKISAERIKTAYGFIATKNIIEKSCKFCRANDKELTIILLCPDATRQLMHHKSRYDREIVEYLQEKQLRYFDMNLLHAEDYKDFIVSIEDYLKRYFIGHYSPAGNHFFAYSIKDKIVEWLEPGPVTYQTEGKESIHFEGYLYGTPE